MIEYTAMNFMHSNKDSLQDKPEATALLAHMTGIGINTSPGDIRQVLASEQNPTSIKPRKVKEIHSVTGPFQVGDLTYYLNKGETITFQGHNYTAHMACIPYHVSQHDVSVMEQALIDCGANGGICGDDMLVLEGSERFLDVFGFAGHKVSQLQIITAQALISTDKGNVIATFHQMA